MARKANHSGDFDALLARRLDNGADYWATPDGRIGVGPFNTINALIVLHELGVKGSHEAVAGAVKTVFANWREDGRIRAAPRGTIYPCHTAVAARAAARFAPDDSRLRTTIDHLLAIRHDDGGWRCRKFSGGRGPETEHSNPGVTLWALDAIRLADAGALDEVEDAVETLLDHWEIRRPIGPCHFGIGSLFMQVEYPFLRYNLFYYVYVLSFFERARADARFREACDVLSAKHTEDGGLVVERPNRNLAAFDLCRKGEVSVPATRRYREILENLG